MSACGYAALLLPSSGDVESEEPTPFLYTAVTINKSLGCLNKEVHGTRTYVLEVVHTSFIQGLSKRFEHHLLWPPRSPDLTPCDFFLWGYVKDNAYKPPLPQNVRELQDRIRAAVQTIDGNKLVSS